MQQVIQTGTQLSRSTPLPKPPIPVLPEDNYEAFLSSETEIVLEWQEVPGAEHYALQVARNRFFVQNVINVNDRKETSEHAIAFADKKRPREGAFSVSANEMTKGCDSS